METSWKVLISISVLKAYRNYKMNGLNLVLERKAQKRKNNLSVIVSILGMKNKCILTRKLSM